ncbi:MAG: hypothetical protein VW405_04765, partial [Rhodospirillaceae bacterium]
MSTDREYASSYRQDLPLFYLDLPAGDPRINNEDYPEQGVAQGFTFNFELTPEEAARLTETSRPTAPPAAAAPRVEATPAEPTPAAPEAETAAPAPATPRADEHPGLIVKSLETGRETFIQPPGTVPPAAALDTTGLPPIEDARETERRENVRKAQEAGIPPTTRTVVGQNRNGETIEEDQRGVRSISKDGVRRAEPVQIDPRGGVSVSGRQNRPDFLTTDEFTKAIVDEANRRLPVFQEDMPDGYRLVVEDNQIFYRTPDDTRIGPMGVFEKYGADYSESIRKGFAEAKEQAQQRAESTGKAPSNLNIGDYVEPIRDRDVLKAGKIAHIQTGADGQQSIQIEGTGQHFSAADFQKAEPATPPTTPKVGDRVRSSRTGAEGVVTRLDETPSGKVSGAIIRTDDGNSLRLAADEIVADAAEAETAGQAPAEAQNEGEPATPAEENADGVPRDVSPRDEGPGAGDVQPPAQDRGARRAPQGEDRGSVPDEGRPAGGPAEVRGRDAEGSREDAGSRASGDRGAGDVPAGRSDTGTERPARPARKPDADVKGTNFAIAEGALHEGRGPMQKARDNIAAIELVRQIEAEGRSATRAEQEKLALYVGWGGLANAFPDGQGKFGKGFAEIGAKLRDLLTDTEYQTARRSIQYAHYTSETVIRNMWSAVERMGFTGGKVFEPGMGVGHFNGLAPQNLAIDYNGLELDHMTARIARLLYPESGIRQDDFTKAPLPTDTYDLVIGNPPFGDIAIQ